MRSRLRAIFFYSDRELRWADSMPAGAVFALFYAAAAAAFFFSGWMSPQHQFSFWRYMLDEGFGDPFKWLALLWNTLVAFWVLAVATAVPFLYRSGKIQKTGLVCLTLSWTRIDIYMYACTVVWNYLYVQLSPLLQSDAAAQGWTFIRHSVYWLFLTGLVAYPLALTPWYRKRFGAVEEPTPSPGAHRIQKRSLTITNNGKAETDVYAECEGPGLKVEPAKARVPAGEDCLFVVTLDRTKAGASGGTGSVRVRMPANGFDRTVDVDFGA